MTRPIADVPDILASEGRLAEELAGRRPAVFLDYDGTLAPITVDPAEAGLPARTRAALEVLARQCPVAIVSGRDLDDVATMAGVEGVAYAGSHGLDIAGPAGRHTHGEEHIDALDRAEAELEAALAEVAGARIERKRFAIAVHSREVGPADQAAVEAAVGQVASAHPRLRLTGGKRVAELRPAVDWDKGRAVLWLLESLGLDDAAALPIYVGDDVTDEDAFAALADRGLCLVVRGEDDTRPTAAHGALADTSAVAELLERLSALVDGGR